MDEFREICKKSKTGSKSFEYGSQGYKDCIRHFLPSSSEVAQLVVQPGSAKDVSEMMKVLRNRPTVEFAVKGGGHGMVPRASSTTGILISMARFDTVEYNSKTTLIKVGSGCLWDQVYSQIYKYKRNVIGGAASQGVGVAGWLLGAGYSLKSNQYGLGIDNIVEYEIVVPDGRILTVTENKEKKLFQALRGGGNNFGIVTSFVLKTVPQTETYGGSFMVPGDRAEEAKVAIANFVAQEDRREAALVSAFRHRLVDGALDYSITFMCVFDGPQPKRPVFEQFKDLMKSGIMFTADLAGWESAKTEAAKMNRRSKLGKSKASGATNRSSKTSADSPQRTEVQMTLNSDSEPEEADSPDSPDSAAFPVRAPPVYRKLMTYSSPPNSLGSDDDSNDPFQTMHYSAVDMMFSHPYAYDIRAPEVDLSSLAHAAAPIMRMSAEPHEEEAALERSDAEEETLTRQFQQQANLSSYALLAGAPSSGEPIMITKPTDSMGELKLRGRFGCIMVSKYTKPLLDKMAEEAEKSASYLKKRRGNMIMVDAWPVHSAIFDNSPPGAAWPHERGKPFGPMLAYFLWEDEQDDEFWLTKLKGTLNRIRTVARNLGLTTSNPAYYSNLSLESVPAKSIYRGNMKRLSKVKTEYDPLDVMGRAGGHKIPLSG
ncbi:hypothetical protein CERSUDRAFT_116778 [Gelatoporia subvermispora B]|uniref:FAD-binding PCMH-type domain-containing protein n=1 Tax=Ceriporiopsis subvermispora (strain B) TaxID=914234 RepID=M2QR07_CERS8|nr:hypothetical protein CERSUDRAFT_116778 [Gelatoporia subvermispora B]